MSSAEDVLNIIRKQFKEGKQNAEELVETVLDLLPDGFGAKVDNVSGIPEKFKAGVTVNVQSLDDVAFFVKKYEEKNNETLRRLTPIIHGQRNEFSTSVYYRCQHKTYNQKTMNVEEVLRENPSKRWKNTGCTFSLVFGLRREEFSACLTLEYNHNHSVNALQTLTFKDIPDDLRHATKQLYENGHTPRTAFKVICKEVEERAADDVQLHQLFADRSVLPLRRDFNAMYTEFKKEKFGSKDLSTMFSILGQTVARLREIDNYKVAYQPFNEEENDPLILVLVSPLMQRVHSMVSNSGELGFIDSSSSMDEYNLRVFVMVTNTNLGALPLAIIITSDETETTLTQAFELLKSCLPENAFYGRGNNGPSVIMTDNCSELRAALEVVWPLAYLLLCSFHILQQLWKWTFEQKHGINVSDRPKIITQFKQILYATDEDDVEELMEDMLDSDPVSKYSNLVKYLKELFERKKEWAHRYRTDLRIRGNNTNNLVEAQFLVLKDDILNRTKEINIIGLVEKLTNEFNDHYKFKLLSVANGKFDGCYSKRFKGKAGKKCEGGGFRLPSVHEQKEIAAKISVLDHNTFLVPSFTSDSSSYTVDMNIGLCDCMTGQNGDVCKHQYILWASKLTETSNFLPYFDPAEKQNCAIIAIGKSLSLDSYEGLHDRLMNSTRNGEDQSTESTPSVLVSQEETPNELSVSNASSTSKSTTDFNNRRFIETVTVGECKVELRKAMATLEQLVDDNCNNSNFLRGTIKFCERAQKYSTSRLCTALHNFGVPQSSSLKITATSSLKRARKGKIYVQPGAIKRRKLKNGSKKAVVKGMRVKKNPFEVDVAKKRLHKFAENVKNKEAVSKKAGRSMSSKTKHLSERQTVQAKKSETVQPTNAETMQPKKTKTAQSKKAKTIQPKKAQKGSQKGRNM